MNMNKLMKIQRYAQFAQYHSSDFLALKYSGIFLKNLIFIMREKLAFREQIRASLIWGYENKLGILIFMAKQEKFHNLEAELKIFY